MRERRETNRPVIDGPERRCLCGRPYRYAWSWALILPARTLLDLCGHCARTLRYGAEDERQKLISAIAAGIERRNQGRVAA